MKWQVQIDEGKTQHCTLPAQISKGVPFRAELHGEGEQPADQSRRVMRRGRQVCLFARGG